MDDISVFGEKEFLPRSEDLKSKLGAAYSLWKQIEDYVTRQKPSAISEWTYPGKKYGWNYRMKDKKRAILYFLPREGAFRVAFVFGQKATDLIMESKVNASIKTELYNARKYAEGRGIRINVNKDVMDDIRTLIDIKLAN